MIPRLPCPGPTATRCWAGDAALPPDLPAGFTPYPKPDSGAAAYRIGRDHIDVDFREGGTCLYSVLSAGRANLDEMARLARKGDGLATFISRVACHLYEQRLE